MIASQYARGRTREVAGGRTICSLDIPIAAECSLLALALAMLIGISNLTRACRAHDAWPAVRVIRAHSE